ncbi:hypothetical protein DMX02_22895 [Pseudomonas jessenii]|nr:hypothetical protein DMX02_22895 [Pseudomonas jessenii]
MNVRNCTNPFVGLRLLAIAVCQSADPLNDTPLSRAGSLLQGIAVHSRFQALSSNVNTSSD